MTKAAIASMCVMVVAAYWVGLWHTIADHEIPFGEIATRPFECMFYGVELFFHVSTG